MMKIRVQAKQARLTQLGLYLTINITGGYAIAQSVSDENLFDLPAINYSLEINLDNLFQRNSLRLESYQPGSDKPDLASIRPMQLVGTLIMGENKLAWIKINENQIHMLEHGQLVPGSALRINRILTDSVELASTEKCYKNSVCKHIHMLDLE